MTKKQDDQKSDAAMTAGFEKAADAASSSAAADAKANPAKSTASEGIKLVRASIDHGPNGSFVKLTFDRGASSEDIERIRELVSGAFGTAQASDAA